MHPFIIQFITEERTRDLRARAERRRAARMVSDRAQRQRRAPRAAIISVRRLRHATS